MKQKGGRRLPPSAIKLNWRKNENKTRLDDRRLSLVGFVRYLCPAADADFFANVDSHPNSNTSSNGNTHPDRHSSANGDAESNRENDPNRKACRKLERHSDHARRDLRQW